MKHVPAAEANRRFSKLLGEVKKGETVVITSHGEPVAQLSPVHAPDRAQREAARRLLWERLDKQPALNLGKMTRDEIYDEIL